MQAGGIPGSSCPREKGTDGGAREQGCKLPDLVVDPTRSLDFLGR